MNLHGSEGAAPAPPVVAPVPPLDLPQQGSPSPEPASPTLTEMEAQADWVNGQPGLQVLCSWLERNVWPWRLSQEETDASFQALWGRLGSLHGDQNEKFSFESLEEYPIELLLKAQEAEGPDAAIPSPIKDALLEGFQAGAWTDPDLLGLLASFFSRKASPLLRRRGFNSFSFYLSPLSPKTVHLSVIYHSNGPQMKRFLVTPLCLLLPHPNSLK